MHSKLTEEGNLCKFCFYAFCFRVVGVCDTLCIELPCKVHILTMQKNWGEH